MRTRFDQFAKQVIERAFSGTGEVATEVEVVVSEAQQVDVVYVPDPAYENERRALGLLGAMGAVPALFEPFHEAPGTADVLDCLRKQLTMHQSSVLRAKREKQSRPERQRLLWVIAAG